VPVIQMKASQALKKKPANKYGRTNE